VCYDLVRTSKGSVLHLLFASRTRSLATPFTHSLESDSITLFVWRWRIVLHSLSITRGERSNQGANYHIETSEA
jgi:hypothetical protein